jgi:transposase
MHQTHHQSLVAKNIKLHNELVSLGKERDLLRNKFDKYVDKSKTKISSLLSENEQLREEVKKLQCRAVDLERKLGMDSSNSSIPPSLDRKFKKCKSAIDLPRSSKKGINLLSKLNAFIDIGIASIPALSAKDVTLLSSMLLDEDFTVTGCYGRFNKPLTDMLAGNISYIAPEVLGQLVQNDKFNLLANYNLRGGQAGHKGQYLEQSANPNEVKYLVPDRCDCGCTEIEVLNDYEARQQINLLIEKIVTEYRLLSGYCKKCGNKVKAESQLPTNVSYHPMIRCYAVYMLDAHYMPYERLATYFKDVFGLSISEGSINNWRKEFASKLGDGYISALKEILHNASYLHADETGLNVGGSNVWAHVVCNEVATLLTMGPRRGMDGITASNVLNDYGGKLIVDGFSAYKSLPSISGIQACFAHLFRYIKDITENYKQTWCAKMGNLLKTLMDQASNMADIGIEYSEAAKAKIIKEYHAILKAGAKEIKQIKYPKGNPAVCLFNRFNKEQDSILQFLNDIKLPLTNNQAERDLRSIKVQQKISGCALSTENAQENLDIRSFTSTSRKQNRNVLDTMYRIFRDPLDFELNTT